MGASAMQCARDPIYDINPTTGVSIEVFFWACTLETFGKCGGGWLWWSRRRGCSPDGSPIGPFATSYAAYRHAMNTTVTQGPDRANVGIFVGTMQLHQ
jgi:hypothetical protein